MRLRLAKFLRAFKAVTMKNVRKLLLSPSGRIARIPYIIGVAILIALYTAQHYIYPYLGKGLTSFFVPMVFFFLNLHIIFCISGKRLHDLGRSTWPLFGMFALLLMTMMIVGLKFGMLEYFESVSKLMNDPLLQADPEAMRAAVQPLEQAYQQNMQENMHKIGPMLALVPLAFAIWLASTPGQNGDNRYGSNPAPSK